MINFHNSSTIKMFYIVKRRNGKNVALIAEDELSSLLESVYLLRSPENAKRLHRALQWSELEDAQPLQARYHYQKD